MSKGGDHDRHAGELRATGAAVPQELGIQRPPDRTVHGHLGEPGAMRFIVVSCHRRLCCVHAVLLLVCTALLKTC